MLAAHEMFKNANRVSRAEKALILGFMAGARGKVYFFQIKKNWHNFNIMYQLVVNDLNHWSNSPFQRYRRRGPQ